MEGEQREREREKDREKEREMNMRGKAPAPRGKFPPKRFRSNQHDNVFLLSAFQGQRFVLHFTLGGKEEIRLKSTPYVFGALVGLSFY